MRIRDYQRRELGMDDSIEATAPAELLLKNVAVQRFDSGKGVFYCQVLEGKSCSIYWCRAAQGGFSPLEAYDDGAGFFAVLLLEGIFYAEITGIGEIAMQTGEWILVYHRRLQARFSSVGPKALKLLVIRSSEEQGEALLWKYELDKKIQGASVAKSACFLQQGRQFLWGGLYQLCSLTEHARHSVLLEPFYEWMANHILQLLFARIGGYRQATKHADPRLLSVVEKIRTEIDSAAVRGHRNTVARLAARAGVHENVLQKAFKQVYGKSIGRYMLEQCMEAARTVLQQDAVPVKVLARKCGYKTVTGFIKAFKSVYGYTPGAVKRQS